MKLQDLHENQFEHIVSIDQDIDDEDIYNLVVSLRRLGYGGNWSNYEVAVPPNFDEVVPETGKDFELGVAMGDDVPSWVVVRNPEMLKNPQAMEALQSVEGQNVYDDDYNEDDGYE